MAARTTIAGCASDIRACVARREYAEAVRRFEILARLLRPRDRSDVAADITQRGGAAAGQALAKAFARAPCYLCKEGRMTCDVCGGASTFAANGRFCETCNGAGHSPCLFCGGTGFLPMENVPRSIVLPAARMRLEWTARLLRQVVRDVSNLSREGATPSPLRDWIRLFHAAERIQAILEDTLPALATQDGGGEEHARSEKLADECDRLARKCRRILAAGILKVCRAKAQTEEPGSQRRIMWERQSDYYEPLARGSSS
ncbi:MAG: hypothetical protein JXB13_11260 [Phycisphaerae bacterium]|nr:hypothetical protein [Phycisphaerae bacterium]